MALRIFDVDGTLTYVFGEIADKTGFHSYAFWDLLTYTFVISPEEVREEIKAWNESMKTEADPTRSSHEMMQKVILKFKSEITGPDLRLRAKEITFAFVAAGVIRDSALKFLNYCLERGDICVLSTGSYLDGLHGFVDALVEGGLIKSGHLANLRFSGAEINWDSRVLLHANVRERKLVGLRRCLKLEDTETLPAISGVYCDDPLINDKGIYEAVEDGCRFVIRTIKNRGIEGWRLWDWESILSLTISTTPVGDVVKTAGAVVSVAERTP